MAFTIKDSYGYDEPLPNTQAGLDEFLFIMEKNLESLIGYNLLALCMKRI